MDIAKQYRRKCAWAPVPTCAGAGEANLARAGESLERHVLDAPDEPAGRDFFRCRPVDAAAVEEVGGVDIGLGAPEDSPPPQVANLLRDDAGVRLVHRDLAYAFVKRKICTPIGGVGKTVSH